MFWVNASLIQRMHTNVGWNWRVKSPSGTQMALRVAQQERRGIAEQHAASVQVI
jgi:hypothetical protein